MKFQKERVAADADDTGDESRKAHARTYDSIDADGWVGSRRCDCGGEVMPFMFSCRGCFVPDPPRAVTVVPFPTEDEWKADLIRRGL